MFIETAAGTILCDPWVNPAYFASWFPFPDNSGLDWDTLGRADYLYVSHLHRDHFDEENLRERISKDTTVLLPEYPTSELEAELRALGFHKFIKTVSEEIVELPGGVKIMIQALTSPTDGPIGDSSLWVEDADGTRLLNQNDARPTDMSVFLKHGKIHAHLLQFSGAIWFPMVYELPENAKRAFGKQKRERGFDRSLRYIDDVAGDWVFPIAGPPCFLDDELYQFNDVFGDEGNIFPDQLAYTDWLERQGTTITSSYCPARSPRSPRTAARRSPIPWTTCASGSRTRSGTSTPSRSARRPGSPPRRRPGRTRRSTSSPRSRSASSRSWRRPSTSPPAWAARSGST
ncbi:hypothetical protein GCM10029992_60660 [Glycomyces albus]